MLSPQSRILSRHEDPDLGSSGGLAVQEKNFPYEHIGECGARRKNNNKKRTVVPVLLSSKGYVDFS